MRKITPKYVLIGCLIFSSFYCYAGRGVSFGVTFADSAWSKELYVGRTDGQRAVASYVLNGHTISSSSINSQKVLKDFKLLRTFFSNRGICASGIKAYFHVNGKKRSYCLSKKYQLQFLDWKGKKLNEISSFTNYN